MTKKKDSTSEPRVPMFDPTQSVFERKIIAVRMMFQTLHSMNGVHTVSGAAALMIPFGRVPFGYATGLSVPELDELLELFDNDFTTFKQFCFKVMEIIGFDTAMSEATQAIVRLADFPH